MAIEITEENKKTCFIITPIGDDNSEIRRQIDGVIDACIEPVLNEKGIEYEVAHRISKTGSINNQIINHIFNDDLVIANLTGLNPNVMYELAFRHAIQKPVIVIKNTDDNLDLPFDVKDDRVIFYKNDFSGSIELKNKLSIFLDNISFETKADNPISRAINDLKIREILEKNILENESDIDKASLSYLIRRLDIIERKMDKNDSFNKVSNASYYGYRYDQIIDDLNNILKCFDSLEENDRLTNSELDDITQRYKIAKSRYNRCRKFLTQEQSIQIDNKIKTISTLLFDV